MDTTAQQAEAQSWTPSVAPTIIALSVMLATFMEVLDTTVVNVSLPHIAGSLSAGTEEATWVLTSYLVANAIVLPATGWLSMLFGRKRFFMTCVAAFTIASLCCGFAPSLMWLVVFRVLQGLAGGALQPISQAILLESFPVHKRGMGMAIFGIGVIFAPIIGPTLGGWITDSYSWRWVFFINIPVGILSLIMTQINIQDPPYLRRGVNKVDYFGLGLLALGIGALQIVLDKGQREDWFQTSWILQLSIVAAVCIALLIVWELRQEHPILDLTIFKKRNYAPGVFLIFVLGVGLYGSMVLTPLFLQSLLGYSAMQSGFALSPGGIGSLIFMPVVGYLVGKRDPRYLIVFGMLMLSFSLFLMSKYNTQISMWDAIYPRIIFGIGLGFLFVPLSTVTMAFVSRERLGTATGIFNLMRNLGGGFGIAGVNTILARRTQFHHARLVEHISTYNPVYTALSQRTVQKFMAAGQTSENAQREFLGITYSNLIRQATAMSFVDCFYLLAMVMIILVPLVFVMRRPPKQAGPPSVGH